MDSGAILAKRIAVFEVDYVKARLQAFAGEANIARVPTPFVVAGDALLPLTILQQKPQLAERIRAFHGALVHVELPFSASVVLIKTNARIQGVRVAQTKASAKVRLMPTTRERNLRRDVRMRRLVAPYLNSDLRAPDVLLSDGGKGQWLVEQQIEGGSIPDPLFARILFEKLQALYRGSVRQRTILRSRQARNWIATARKEIERSGFRLSLTAESTWSVAMVHGDLTASNVVGEPSGRLWLVDWESGGVGPISLELGRLVAHDPVLAGPAIQFLKSVQSGPQALQPEIELACGLAREISLQREHRAAKVDNLIAAHGMPTVEAARLVDRRTQQVEATLREILLAAGPAAQTFRHNHSRA